MHLHRTLIFWGGLFLAAFIVWAWWDSMIYRRTLRTGDRYVPCREISQAHSAVRLSSTIFLDPEETDTPQAHRVPLATEPPVVYKRNKLHVPAKLPPDVPKPGWFPSPATTHYRMEPDVKVISDGVTLATMGSDSHAIIIPYWLILACHLPLWLGLSWWRGSRITKGRAALASPPA